MSYIVLEYSFLLSFICINTIANFNFQDAEFNFKKDE